MSDFLDPIWFDGETYRPEYDHDRLASQLQRVWWVMADGKWHTLRALQYVVGGSEAAISARLRDFRKDRFGNHAVERRRMHKSGLWEYRVIANREPVAAEEQMELI